MKHIYRGWKQGAKLSFFFQPQPWSAVSHPVPGRTELGGEVPLLGVIRREKMVLPLMAPSPPWEQSVTAQRVANLLLA